MPTDFLPVSMDDLKRRGWDAPDIILVTGDAYVDHPSYGVALIGRFLESKGFRVGVIAQPDWRNTADFLTLGRPRLFVGITSGNVDSMVACYTANRIPRRSDDYSPGGRSGLRPERSAIVYANRVREAFGPIPIVLGGIEASLRRLAHYDYWNDAVRRSILADAKADLLIYGMGEAAALEVAERLRRGEPVGGLDGIRGTVVIRKDAALKDAVALPSYEEVCADKEKFNEAFRLAYGQMNPFTARPVVQRHGDRAVIQFPPPLPLRTEELDHLYDLPFARGWHPMYDRQGGVKGFETVRFSIVSSRGCCGECAFCSLYFHQGRIVQSRSPRSIFREAQALSERPDFKGTITDIGGPTANLYGVRCERWQAKGPCDARHCLVPKRCEKLMLGYPESLDLYRQIGGLPRVKHVFIGSGIRYDLLADETSRAYLEELCAHYVSGQMKVAPEHSAEGVLRLMRKPSIRRYEAFLRAFQKAKDASKKDLYLVNYFISAHPGSTLADALALARYLAAKGIHPEQIQDFIPLPMTLSGCMYYTGRDPLTGEKVYVPKAVKERKMHRALIQYKNPQNRNLIKEALRILHAEDVMKEFAQRPAAHRRRKGVRR